MPENTISSVAQTNVNIIDRSQSRSQAQVAETVKNDNTAARSSQPGVEVALSQEARSLGLSSAQQVTATGQADKATASVRPAQAQDDLSPPPENGVATSAARQYDRSASDMLGATVDLRS
jgi:hypothetical protein